MCLVGFRDKIVVFCRTTNWQQICFGEKAIGTDIIGQKIAAAALDYYNLYDCHDNDNHIIIIITITMMTIFVCMRAPACFIKREYIRSCLCVHNQNIMNYVFN